MCHYIGAFQDSKQIYIVMEHASGGDLLEQLLKEGRAMTEKRVVREVRAGSTLARHAGTSRGVPPKALSPVHGTDPGGCAPTLIARARWTPQVVAPVLSCLAHLHAAGVIHRDIKLENLFVSPMRGVLLGDFGLALCTHEEKPISPVGTLGMQPQRRGAGAKRLCSKDRSLNCFPLCLSQKLRQPAVNPQCQQSTCPPRFCGCQPRI